VSSFWDRQEFQSDYEMLEEGEQQYQEEQVLVSYNEIDESEIEKIQDNSVFDLDEKETCVIYNARLRLEQARLYELLINHNLFEGVAADEQAVDNVQKELKDFIIFRLEILLGLKKPKPQAIVQAVESPFNDVEVDFLKQLAYKGTRGASVINSSDSVSAPIKPVTSPPINTLKPISSSQNSIKPVNSAPVKSTPKEPIKPTPKTPVKAPAKPTPQKTKETQNIKSTESVRSKIKNNTVSKRSLTPSEVEAIAREELKISANKKPWSEMNAKEKAQEIARVNERHKKPNASNIPMLTPEQMEMHYMQQQMGLQRSNNPEDRIKSALAAAIVQTKNKQ